MLGCLRKLGCLVLILAAVLAAWYAYARMDKPNAPEATGTSRVAQWEPVTPEGAARGQLALEALSNPFGPNFVSLSAGDVASYVFFSAANRLPDAAYDIEAAVLGDQLAVRATVPLRELGVGRIMGPLASLMGDSDRVYFSGSLTVAQPEIGQYRVRELRIEQLRVPSGLVPRVLRQLDRGDHPAGVAADALALPLPAYITDIRTGDGVVTLYKTAR